MSNTYFQFRQFRIEQDRCAMKVSTDACVQGAWTPMPEHSQRILDIGTGTGLLSLMLAQRSPGAIIDAVELDNAAAGQALENIQSSPFAAQIHVHATDARVFAPQYKYDLIISNPPFFKDSLHGPDAARNQARHNLSLQQEDMIRLFDKHLTTKGQAAILWPGAESEAFIALAVLHGWYATTQLCFKDRVTATRYRAVTVFGRTEKIISREELVLKEPDGSYTAAFKELLSPFYLHL